MASTRDLNDRSRKGQARGLSARKSPGNFVAKATFLMKKVGLKTEKTLLIWRSVDSPQILFSGLTTAPRGSVVNFRYHRCG